MQRAFTLLETLIAILLFGIFGIFSEMLLLEVYKDYTQQNAKTLEQLHTQNALLQIKKILEDSHLQSLKISDNTQISNTTTSLKGKTLIFYPKVEEWAIYKDYSIPCISGIFELDNMQISAHLTLKLLQIDKSAAQTLNKKCKMFQKDSAPKNALFITQDFNVPQDFYNPSLKGRISQLSATSITLEIPPIFRHSSPINVSPRLYILTEPKMLHFKDSILLQSAAESQTLIENFTDFLIYKHSLGFSIKLCANFTGEEFCKSAIVMELE